MSIFVPKIRDYAPFYIQRSSDTAAIDIQTAYGVTIKTHEYPSKLAVKEPYKNEWKDAHGDDEWADALYYEAFELETEGVIITEESDSATARLELRKQVRAFQTDLSQGEFSIYDDWTKFGFQKVRLSSFGEIDDDGFDAWDGHARLIFKFTLKINDPVTMMTLTDGAIVAEG